MVLLYISTYPRMTKLMPTGHSIHIVLETLLPREETAFVTTLATTTLARLLPDATTLRLEACEVDDTTAQITLRVTSTQTAGCLSGLRSGRRTRIHSRYTRTLVDLPWAAYRVRLQVRVRKWFCAQPCLWAPHLYGTPPTVAAPWARRTLRLVQRLVALGLALGGRAGGRLSHAWDIAVSRHTLLRGLRRHPVPVLPTPTVLGVDDFALRKGQTYGTVLIDLERRQPVALLPDRTAATLAQWLQAHPGVQVIARDRATAYADGARQGGPRRHPGRRSLASPPQSRRGRGAGVPPASQGLTSAPRAGRGAPPGAQRISPRSSRRRRLPRRLSLPHSCHRSAGASPRHTHRRQRYEQVCHLARQGWTFQAIAQQVGLHRKTVAQYVRADSFPVRARPRSGLDPYKPYLLDCWNRGVSDGDAAL